MTTISNNVIQADLIAYLQADTDLVAAMTAVNALANATDIKEDQYVGRDFNFPAVRVDVQRQTAIDEEDQCTNTRLMFTLWIYTESGSSKNCDSIAGVAHRAINRQHLAGTGYNIPRMRADLIGATRIEDRLWRASVICRGNVRPSG